MNLQGLMQNLGVIIFIVIMLVSVLSSILGQKKPNQTEERKRRTLEEWDELQARRREEHRNSRNPAQAEALEELQADASRSSAPGQPQTPDPSKMTMAQRIELARERARQQAGGTPHQDSPGDALRRARERAEAEARRRREAAERQRQAEQDQAEREARQREAARRRRAEEERARTQRQQSRRSRSQQRSQQSRASQARSMKPALPPVKGKASRSIEQGDSRRAKKQSSVSGTAGKRRRGKVGLGPGSFNAAALRKAFVMKELLDKPLALRNPQDEQLS